MIQFIFSSIHIMAFHSNSVSKINKLVAWLLGNILTRQQGSSCSPVAASGTTGTGS